METRLDNLFYMVKEQVYKLMDEKDVDINILAFNLGIDTQQFINNFRTRINDFTFYLQTLNVLDNWEVK